MTPKEALIKDGTIPVKEGRGRLSREANDRCSWLVENKGWSIKGYNLKQATTSAAPVVKKTVVNNTKVIEDYVIFYEEENWTATDSSGKIWGMREVCNNCMVSLVQCHCGKPTILGDIKLTLKPKVT